jgi:flagellar hook-associated protein 1
VSLAATLNSALTGLNTSQRALGTTANNVANVNTEGYARKAHVQTNQVIDGRGAGVRSGDPARVFDEFVSAELRLQSSRLESRLALKEVHDRLQISLFGEISSGLPSALDRLRAAVETLANSAEKLPAKAGVVGAAEDLARDIRAGAELIQSLRRDLDRQIGGEVDAINADLQELVELNRQFNRGMPTAELADQRDLVLDRLALRLDIKASIEPSGAVSVYTRSGQALLDRTAQIVHYDPAVVVTSETVFSAMQVFAPAQIDPATGQPLAGEVGVRLVNEGLRAEIPPESSGYDAIRSSIRGGRLQGLIEARDDLLPGLNDQLGEFTRLLRFTVDAAHNAAVPHPLPDQLTGSRTDHAAFDPGLNSGTAYIAVVERGSGTTLATIGIDATLGTPAAIVAQLNSDLAGYGTAALDPDGRLVIDLADPAQGLAVSEGDSAVRVTDAAGHDWTYGLVHYFGLNDFFAPEGSQPSGILVREDIAADNTLVANVSMTVDAGPPPVGAAGGAGDNRGFQALAAAFDQRIEAVARGPLAGSSTTLTRYLGDFIGLEAMQAARIEADTTAGGALVQALESRKASVSGVNLDEEMSRLVLYQHAYTVSARIIQITDRLFEELLSIAR